MSIKSIRLILLGFTLLGCISTNANPPINICLTGKVETTLPDYKTAFVNAANLALINNPVREHVDLKTYFFDSKPLSPIRAYDLMVRDNCAAIIGFEYLSDLLLIAKTQKNEKIPIFTSYASSLESDTLPHNIFIFMPSYDYQAKKMMGFIQKNIKQTGNALIITEIDREDLARYKIAYSKLLDQKKIHYDTLNVLENDNQLEKKLNKITKEKKYKLVFVLCGAVGATKIINNINNPETIFIGTENFGSSTNQSVYVRLNKKTVNAYTIRNIDFLKTTDALSAFAKDYKKYYNTPPSPLSAYTYDATSIILKSLKKYHSVSTKNILKLNYTGITGAYIKNGRFHRSNQYIILFIKKNGFGYAEKNK